jgi:hypothetical protein
VKVIHIAVLPDRSDQDGERQKGQSPETAPPMRHGDDLYVFQDPACPARLPVMGHDEPDSIANPGQAGTLFPINAGVVWIVARREMNDGDPSAPIPERSHLDRLAFFSLFEKEYVNQSKPITACLGRLVIAGCERGDDKGLRC